MPKRKADLGTTPNANSIKEQAGYHGLAHACKTSDNRPAPKNAFKLSRRRLKNFARLFQRYPLHRVVNPIRTLKGPPSTLFFLPFLPFLAASNSPHRCFSHFLHESSPGIAALQLIASGTDADGISQGCIPASGSCSLMTGVHFVEADFAPAGLTTAFRTVIEDLLVSDS